MEPLAAWVRDLNDGVVTIRLSKNEEVEAMGEKCVIHDYKGEALTACMPALRESDNIDPAVVEDEAYPFCTTTPNESENIMTFCGLTLARIGIAIGNCMKMQYA
ncbi:hypothetical protein NDU88_006370 [Pleurodeles waltl]|uniref:Uncharacterized protein n=1 Tax=Pleurodeles waltl TaxID=8319 RepID=A0AAV7QHU2_PLEWA|nr:hypothetical protein NDU88_006370 [Pleurodeles waltl]